MEKWDDTAYVQLSTIVNNVWSQALAARDGIINDEVMNVYKRFLLEEVYQEIQIIINEERSRIINRK